MSTIHVTIQGQTPLLMNRFTDANAEQVSVGSSSAIMTRDRGTPRTQAEPRLYLTADNKPMVPGPNVFAALIAAGAFHKAGRKQITTGRSSLVPAGVSILDVECPISNPHGEPVTWEVDSRRVVNGKTNSAQLCHRPRFDAWSISFTLLVDDKMFSEQIVRTLVDDAGSKVGLGDFRLSRKGPFGRFVVTGWQKDKNV